MKNKFMISYLILCVLMVLLTMKVNIERGYYELDGVLYMGCTDWYGVPTIGMFILTFLMSVMGMIISLFYKGRRIILILTFFSIPIVLTACLVFYASFSVRCPENSRSLLDATRVAAWAAYAVVVT